MTKHCWPPNPEAGTLAERRQPTIAALIQIIHENALPGTHLADRRIRQSLETLWKTFLEDLEGKAIAGFPRFLPRCYQLPSRSRCRMG